MAADRRTPTAGPMSGSAYATDVNDEISRLYNGIGMFLENIPENAINNINGTVSPTLDAYARGQILFVEPVGLNTTSVQINVDQRGFKSAVDVDGSEFAAGALSPGHIIPFVYDGTKYRRLAIPGIEGPSGGTAELAEIVAEVLSLEGETWHNGVRGRMPGVEKTSDLDNLVQHDGSHNVVALPTVKTFKLSDAALYGHTGARNYLFLSYSQALLDKQPVMYWFIPKSHIEATGITIAGTGGASFGQPPAANVSRLSMKIGLINSMMTQHDLAGMDIDFLLTYGPVGDDTSADGSYIAVENIRFAKDETTNSNAWGEPGGQPAAPDATFWADSHTAGVNDDGTVTTYWHENVPVPLTWGTYEFKGVKLIVRGSHDGASLPLTLGVINLAVIPASVDLRGPTDDNYYLQFLNYEDLAQPVSDGGEGTSTILATIGDSHTEDIWPSLVSERIGGEYFNFAVGGESSGQMIPRFQTLIDSSPNMVGLYASPNDPGGDTTVAASPAPTDTVFTVASAAKLGVGSWVIVNGETRQIEAIASNEITLTEALSAPPSGSDAVEIATQRNNEHMVDLCWEAQIYRIFIVGSHYKNWSTAGDTVDVEQTVAETLRNKQKAAAASRGVLYVDTYRWFSSLIRVGAEVQGDFRGHDADGDPHLNDIGQDIQIARPVEQALRQAGWV